MDVMNKEQAKIAEEAGACAVMALERGSACAEICPSALLPCLGITKLKRRLSSEASQRTSARARFEGRDTTGGRNRDVLHRAGAQGVARMSDPKMIKDSRASLRNAQQKHRMVQATRKEIVNSVSIPAGRSLRKPPQDCISSCSFSAFVPVVVPGDG